MSGIKILEAGSHAGSVDLFSSSLQTLSPDRKSDLDTSLMFARAGLAATHFVHEWVNTCRHELHQNITQGDLTRHNKACLIRLPWRYSAAD